MEKKRRCQKGDVFSVALRSGYYYLQFVGKLIPFRFDVFRVVDLVTAAQLQDPVKVVNANSLYWICSICSLLAEDTHFMYIGNARSCPSIPPMRMSSIGGFIIVENGRETMVPNLSEETARLSIVEALSSQEIIERLSSNWRPEHDRDDAAAFLKRHTAGRSTSQHETAFTIEFTSPVSASKGEQRLKSQGLPVSKINAKTLRVLQRFKDANAIDDFEESLQASVRALNGRITARETSL